MDNCTPDEPTMYEDTEFLIEMAELGITHEREIDAMWEKRLDDQRDRSA